MLEKQCEYVLLFKKCFAKVNSTIYPFLILKIPDWSNTWILLIFNFKHDT